MRLVWIVFGAVIGAVVAVTVAAPLLAVAVTVPPLAGAILIVLAGVIGGYVADTIHVDKWST